MIFLRARKYNKFMITKTIFCHHYLINYAFQEELLSIIFVVEFIYVHVWIWRERSFVCLSVLLSLQFLSYNLHFSHIRQSKSNLPLQASSIIFTFFVKILLSCCFTDVCIQIFFDPEKLAVWPIQAIKKTSRIKQYGQSQQLNHKVFKSRK